ncbi:hypothetical protein, partial [Teichococcus cervicalis]
RPGTPSGRYFHDLFVSQERDFTIDPGLLRSKHPMQPEGEALRLRLEEAPPTLLFGPYVRIPAGRWTLRAELLVEALPAAPAQDPNPTPPVAPRAGALLPRVMRGARELMRKAVPRAETLVLRVMKGVPWRELGQAALPLAALRPGSRHVLEVSFDNPRDTGEIETVI